MNHGKRYEYENMALATHAFLVGGKFTVRSGPTIPLLNYFLPKCKRFFLICQPPPYVEDSLAPFLLIYEAGALKETLYNKWLYKLYDIPPNKRRVMTSLKLKLRDLFSVIYFSYIIRRTIGKETIEYFIGVESVNAVAIYLSKVFLSIRATIYYAFDWSIIWFNNNLLNFLYIQFDKWACRLSDFNWNATHRIETARRSTLGYGTKVLNQQMTVPFGMMTFREEIVPALPSERPKTVVYCGELSYENGSHLLPEIAGCLWKMDKEIRLIVIGGGEQFDEVRNKITESGITNMEMRGHLVNQGEIDQILVRCHVAIAPYLGFTHSKKRFGDVVKIRNYFSCGLPVVATDVPPIADEIQIENLGRVVPPEPEKIAAQCIDIMEKWKEYLAIRKNVVENAKAYHWKKIYDETFKKMALKADLNRISSPADRKI